MSEIIPKATITYTVTLKLTEDEARALAAITAYGAKQFLEVFYKHLGKADLQPHESGLVALFDSTDLQIKSQLRTVDAANIVLKQLDKHLDVKK